MAVLAILASPLQSSAADWPYWRGPLYNGQAEASGLPDDWDPKGGAGSNLIWKREEFNSICTPIVMNGRLYTIQRAEPDTPREGEQVVCLDAASGETLWTNRFNVWMSDVPAERIGWSSVVGDPETGNVYALGACDYFLCIDGESGETVWSIPLHEQFGMLSTYGGRTNFPVIHEDLVIVSGIIINWGDFARPNHRLIGLDKLTGQVIWFSGTRDLPDDTTYSAPSLVTIDGQRQLILGGGDGAIWSFQPRTGKALWRYDLSWRGIFAAPLVDGNRVFAGHGQENISTSSMGAVVGLKVSGIGDDTKVEQLWKQREILAENSEPVLIDNRLYLLDDRNKMWIFDADTGELIVDGEKVVSSRQRSALLYADNKIYVFTENGPWAILEPTSDGFEVLNKGRDRSDFSGSPIVADGRVYVPSSTGLYCLGTGEGTQTSVSIADSMGEELPVDEHPEISQILLIPAEGIVRPGESLELSTRVFNALGQRLPDSDEVTFEVDGPGTVTDTTFTADPDVAHTAATITARVGDAVGTARVRIVPPLPWKFTFDQNNDAPLSWIGARYRHVIRTVDGSPALVKITTIPKGARSRAWIGPSDLKEYTMTADVRGARMADKLPDIGLSNMGYVLDLMGESQQLQIRTWAAQLRMAQSVPFEWKEDTWYRMKFRSDIESEGDAAVAVLRGKVWPKGTPEPKEWTIEAIDESPNLAASPGLYGNAKDAELYIDNLEVIANESAE